MDGLSRMEGKGRFYVNGPIDNNLEYTVTVEGVGSTMWKRGVYGDDVSRVEVGGGKPGQVHISSYMAPRIFVWFGLVRLRFIPFE